MHLQSFLPKEHPCKKVFEEHGIKISQVAKCLGLSYTYTSSILTGLHRVTPQIERKLKALVKQLEDMSNN